MTFHCFFEQSGTFKNEFRKLGYEAYDYDILDDFGETDFKIDLFKEIETAYEGGESVFDSIKEEDQIIAFFPCIRFEDQVLLWFRGENYSQRKWNDLQKLKYDIRIHDELNKLYKYISMLVVVCIERRIPLIIENPYSTQHYLQKYWCIKPKIIDKNRREKSDFFNKPTQYWFINRNPSNNLIFDAYSIQKKKNVANAKAEDGVSAKVNRSMISKDYANRFIREFIL